jgi:hypothetical protein
MTEKQPSYDDPDFTFDLGQADLDEFSALQTVSGLKGAALRRAWARRKRESK